MKTPAILLAALGLALSSLHAQTVPLLINYQGKVTDSAGVGLGTGTPINRKMLFRIYNAPTGAGAARLWTEEQTVTISGGEFSVILGNGIAATGTAAGESRPVLDTVFTATAGSTRYLGVTVDNADNVITAADVEITPRQQLTSTAYTLRAGAADSIPLNSDLKINGTADYGLGWYGTGRLFNSVAVNGPVLYGLGGGALGISNGATKTIALQWDASRNITGLNNLTATGTVTAPTFVGNVTGNVTGSAGSAASVTGTLAGDVTGTQSATVIAAGTVTGKALTGFVSGAGTVTATDTILTAINKLNGNVSAKANIASPTFTGTVTATTFSGNATTATSATTATTAGNVSGIVALANGGTGSATKNFVDLTTNQLTIAGNKTFTGTTTFNAPIFTGTLGLGLGATPAATTARLDIKGAGAAFPATTGTDQSLGHVVRLRDSGTQLALDIGGNGSTNGFWLQSTNIADLTQNYPLLLNPNGGNVGIGTNNPKAPLHVKKINYAAAFKPGPADPSYGVHLGGNGSVLDFDYFNNEVDGYVVNYSAIAGLFEGQIVATADIWIGSALTYSDARAKKIAGGSDGTADLATLLRLQVKDWTWIDRTKDQHRPHKKLIAQEVEKVFPQAVSITPTPQVIPSVYEMAETVVHEASAATLTITTKKEHGFQAGDKVDLYADKSEMKAITVKAVTSPHQFIVASDQAVKNVFVYGKEVKDFRSVDYEAIAMLNVSATQQIKKEKDAEVAELKSQITARDGKIAALEKSVAALEARDQIRDAKLAAIEKLLRSTGQPAARPASLKLGAGAE